MKTIEQYAVDMVASGAESVIEDDLNEDGDLNEDDHTEACALAMAIVRAIRDNPEVVLALGRHEQIRGTLLDLPDGALTMTPEQQIRLECARILGAAYVNQGYAQELARDVLRLGAAIETGESETDE